MVKFIGKKGTALVGEITEISDDSTGQIYKVELLNCGGWKRLILCDSENDFNGPDMIEFREFP